MQTENIVEFSDRNCVEDHNGESYRTVLMRLHSELRPATYLEIGTLGGETLALSGSPSIAIDPKFKLHIDAIGSKSVCLFYQMPSDMFFENYKPDDLLGAPIEFSFLDGMHHCEYLLRDFINAERHSASCGLIALHDCLPVEIPMTDRMQNGTPPIRIHRHGWWTGDVWRTIVVLKKYRPDLKLICLDAAPTGLVLVSHLNPASSFLTDHYDAIVAEMYALDLGKITVETFLRRLDVQPTECFREPGSLSRALGRPG